MKKKMNAITIILAIAAGVIYAISLHWLLSQVLLFSTLNEISVIVACLFLYIVALLMHVKHKTHEEKDRYYYLEKALYLFAASFASSILLFHYVSLYDEAHFEAAFGAKFKLIKKSPVSGSRRTIYLWKK